MNTLSCEMNLRSSLRPVTRAMLALLTAAWLMLALQPCAMAMGAMDDCEQCPPSEAGIKAQAGCLSSASCAARQDWQHTVPAGIVPLMPSLPSVLAWYEAPPVVLRVAVVSPPEHIVSPPLQRFERLRI